MKNIAYKLYTVWVLLVFITTMLLYLPFIIIPAFFGNKGVGITYVFMKIWSWSFSKLTFIRYHIRFRDKIVTNKAVIYISNHTSFLDLPGIAMSIHGQFRPLAKKELLNIPIFGWITRVTCVVVDRENSQSRRESMEYLKKILLQRISILIFPEGTQNRSKELLQPFKDGAFKIALDTAEDVQPLAVIGAGRLMPPGKAKVYPGTIKIIVGDPIDVRPYLPNKVSELKEKTVAAITDMINQNL